MTTYIHELVARFDHWTIIGLAGQGMFFLRFAVQWLSSERAGRSVIPMAFWYLSIAGALIVLVYGLRQREIILIAGQGAALAIYLRNIVLIRRRGGT